MVIDGFDDVVWNV